MYISTPIDLIEAMNEEIYRFIADEKERQRQVFSYKNGKIWVSFDDECFYSVVLRSDTLILVGATETTKPDQTLFISKSKKKDSFERNGKTYNFAPECQQAFTSKCEKTDFFKYPP